SGLAHGKAVAGKALSLSGLFYRLPLSALMTARAAYGACPVPGLSGNAGRAGRAAARSWATEAPPLGGSVPIFPFRARVIPGVLPHPGTRRARNKKRCRRGCGAAGVVGGVGGIGSR